LGPTASFAALWQLEATLVILPRDGGEPSLWQTPEFAVLWLRGVATYVTAAHGELVRARAEKRPPSIPAADLSFLLASRPALRAAFAALAPDQAPQVLPLVDELAAMAPSRNQQARSVMAEFQRALSQGPDAMTAAADRLEPHLADTLRRAAAYNYARDEARADREAVARFVSSKISSARLAALSGDEIALVFLEEAVATRRWADAASRARSLTAADLRVQTYGAIAVAASSDGAVQDAYEACDAARREAKSAEPTPRVIAGLLSPAAARARAGDPAVAAELTWAALAALDRMKPAEAREVDPIISMDFYATVGGTRVSCVEAPDTLDGALESAFAAVFDFDVQGAVDRASALTTPSARAEALLALTAVVLAEAARSDDNSETTPKREEGDSR